MVEDRRVMFIFLLLFLCLVFVTLSSIGMVSVNETIYIKADGSVEGTEKIQRQGNICALTSDVFNSIVGDKDNIVINGSSYTLEETEVYNSRDINLLYRSNATSKI